MEGTEQDVNKFIERVLSFKLSVPRPSSEDDNWGTKWDAYDQWSISHLPGKLEDGFNTAWDPPRDWLAAIGKKYTGLRITDRWYDESYPRSGEIIWKMGVQLRNDYYDHQNREQAKDFLQRFFPEWENEDNEDESSPG